MSARKKKNDNDQLSLMIDGSICHDQAKIANYFCNYFADGTSDDSFATHASVQSIMNNSTGTDNFQFQRVNKVEVGTALQGLNTAVYAI